MHQHYDKIKLIARQRMVLSLSLSVALFLAQFVFYGLIAFGKPTMGHIFAPGMSVGVTMAFVMFPITWIVLAIYVTWSNKTYDRTVSLVRDNLL